MKNLTTIDRSNQAKQNPPSTFLTQLQNIIPTFALQMPPPRRHKHFQLCLVLTKKPPRHQGWDYCFPNSAPCPHLSLQTLGEAQTTAGASLARARQERWELGTGRHHGINHTEKRGSGKSLGKQSGLGCCSANKSLHPRAALSR